MFKMLKLKVFQGLLNLISSSCPSYVCLCLCDRRLIVLLMFLPRLGFLKRASWMLASAFEMEYDMETNTVVYLQSVQPHL